MENQSEAERIWESGNAFYEQGNYIEACEAYQKVTELNPENANAYCKWGLALAKLNKYEEAIEKYQKAIELNPEYADAYNNWGIALKNLNKYEEAIEKYQKAIELNPEYADAYNNWGDTLYNLNKYEEAIEKYQKAIELNPDYADAYTNWGSTLDNLNKYEEAIEKYQKAIELNPDYADAYTNWGSTLDNLKKYEQAIEKYEQAIEKYQKAIKLNPDDAIAYKNWGKALAKLNRYKEAIEKYQKAIELNPDYADAYNNWGNALYYLNKYKEAIEKYQKAIELNPKEVLAYNNWGSTLDNLKKYEEAIEKYQKAIELNPDYATAYYNWGVSLKNLKKYKEAIEKYQKAIKLNPEDADAYINCGLALANRQNYREAIEKFQDAARVDADNDLTYLFTIAYFYWRQGRYELARKKWQELVYGQTTQKIEESKNPDRFQILGSLRDFFGEFKEAEEIYKKGLELETDCIGILLSLVNLYLQKKDEDDNEITKAYYWDAWENYLRAESLLKCQLKTNPKDTSNLLKLSQLYLTMEEYEDAEKNSLEALTLDKDLAKAYVNLGFIYTCKDDFQKGAYYFKEALKREPHDLTVWSNLAEVYFKLKQLDKAEAEYKKILGITQEHIESHIGLGEVYTAMGESDGDGDIYEQAVSHFNKAINLSQSQRGSKRLKKKELAAVFYSRGYARVKLYEASKTTGDESLLNKASQDFKDCSKNDTSHDKAKRALEKIKKKYRDLQPQWLREKLGPVAIFFFSIIVFGLAQYGFFFAQTNQPEKSTKPVASVAQTNQPKKSTKPVASVAQTKPPEKSTNTAKLLDSTNYTLLTFGSLGFMAVALYLPQILKLKIGTVELEKSAVDQIKTSVELGIRRSEPQPSAIASLAQLKPIQSDR